MGILAGSWRRGSSGFGSIVMPSAPSLDNVAAAGNPRSVPHRDDREAAHQRIAALETELADARARAEDAEQKASEATRRLDEASAHVERGKAKVGKKKARPARSPKVAPEPDGRPTEARWPPGGVARYRQSVFVTVLVVYAPVVVALLLPHGPLPDDPPPYVALLGAPVAIQLVATYVIGRACGAPFPASGVMVTMLSAPIVLMAVVAGASEMFWGTFLAAGAFQWVVRGLVGSGALMVGGVISAAWSSEAASSDVGRD
jgi:hypothetical protein